MPISTAHSPSSQTARTLATLDTMAMTVIAAIIVAALYLGSEVFVPLALAILLSFVLAPLVRLLRRAHLPRAVAAVIAVLFSFGVLGALGTLIGNQVNQLAGELPRYETTIRQKVIALRGASAGTSALGQAADMLQNLGTEISRPTSGQPASSQAGHVATGTPTPIPVILNTPPAGAIARILTVIEPLLHPLAMTGIIAVFVLFILLEREDLRNRFVRLAGTRDIQRTTAALDDAGSRLSRLLIAQLMINSVFGLIVGVGLFLIGVPSAILWGVLGAILRFVPYIGAIIAAIFPLALAVAVDPGWSMVIMTATLFAVIEPVIGHGLEPIFLGRSTGLSPVAVVLAAAFWTMLWGPVGLLLATPLTVCLVVIGRHVERLSFLDILLGDRPALQPWELFYQRVLADDVVEATDHAARYLAAHNLADYYDEILLRGLKLAQDDAMAGKLDRAATREIRDTVADLVEQFDAFDSETALGEGEGALRVFEPGRLPESWTRPNAIICVGSRSPLDESAGLALADLLGHTGLEPAVYGIEALTGGRLAQLDLAATRLIVISCLDGDTQAHLRNLVRRLQRRAPSAQLMIGLWKASADEATGVAAAIPGSETATSVREAATRIVAMVGEDELAPAAATATMPAVTDATDLPLAAVPAAGIVSAT